MKIVRVLNNRVVEIIPDAARPVSKWYNEVFAAQCIEAPDDVKSGYFYNPETKTFSKTKPEDPVIEKPITTEDILNVLLGVTEDE